jgi:hypothetical protein
MRKVIHVDDLLPHERDYYTIRPTTALEKVTASAINAVFAFGCATPFLIAWGPTLSWKISVVGMFALYEALVFSVYKDRCFGMQILNMYHKYRFNTHDHILYCVFYALSFSTCLIYIWFPFDLLLINIFFVQLPMVLMTGTTLHGWLSGIESVRLVRTR